jgi:hypothetical protein
MARPAQSEPIRNGLRLIQVFYADNNNPGSPRCDRDGCGGRSVAMFVKLASGDNKAYCLCHPHCVEEWGERPPTAEFILDERGHQVLDNQGRPMTRPVQMYFGRV